MGKNTSSLLLHEAQTFVFIDIDGTLVDSDKQVPASARSACEQARRNGHQLVLSTGRSLPELDPRIVAVGFDGIISASGGYVSWNGEELFENPIPMERLRELIAYFRAHDFEFLWQASRGVWGDAGLLELLRKAVRPDVTEGLPREWEVFGDTEEYSDVLKALFDAPNPQAAARFREEFDAKFTIVSGSLDSSVTTDGEITAAGVSKGSAMRQLREHLNVPEARFIAIGDSENDASMIREADYGIAMGNAVPRIKQLADMETDSVDNDGFAKAFKRLGLV